MSGKFITVEGIDGCGKDTQLALLKKHLKQKGINAVLTHEPGGTLYGEALRAILKFPEQALEAIYQKFSGHSDFPLLKLLNFDRTPLCELFLFEAARAEYAAVVRKILATGTHVISNRLHDSTTAYQGGGRGLPLADIDLMNRIALGNLWPDLTLLIDIPVSVMIGRISREASEKKAYFEKNFDSDKFERIRQTYLDIAKNEPGRFRIVNGDQPIEAVFRQIKTHVDKLLGIEE